VSPAIAPGVLPATGDRPPTAPRWVVGLLWVQGLYFLVTGLWPIIHIESFELVTGEKTDDWLVITVGVMIVAVAVVLLTAAWRRRCPAEVALLAVATAAGLTAIDVVYVSRGVIPPVYLLDAVAEVVLIAAWVTAVALGRFRHRGA
jgi:hypothetical protein